MKFISAFAGIGGFDKGFERAGLTVTHQIEWDTHCQQILRHHYPHATLKGDICDVIGSELGRPQLFAGGFPCQDTSIGAPHRSGLAGRRSGHFFEFARLIEESARIIDATDPRWVVIENPTGLLKSKGGADMATVVRTLEDLGYGWAYRVVDGRDVGTPQRRGRVIVVGHRGGDPRPAWNVLADHAPGSEVAAPRPVGRRPIGLAPDGGAVFDAVWRKSARARASLDKGGYETWVSDGVANTLTGFDGGGPLRQTHLIAQAGRLRTLTLTEWERLQGFDDHWTEGIPPSARYTAIGNAMHVGMAYWLGTRLMQEHTRVPQLTYA